MAKEFVATEYRGGDAAITDGSAAETREVTFNDRTVKEIHQCEKFSRSDIRDLSHRSLSKGRNGSGRDNSRRDSSGRTHPVCAGKSRKYPQL